MDADRKTGIRHFRDLEVYRRAFAAAMEIFEIETIIGMLSAVEKKSDKFCY